MRRRKARQIVCPNGSAFPSSSVQASAEMFAGEMGKRSARRLMKHQRLQPGVAQPAQKRFIPRLIALR
jgi:hypothetical protein